MYSRSYVVPCVCFLYIGIFKVKIILNHNSIFQYFHQYFQHTLTSLMQGKMQCGKLRKKDNMEAVSEELRKRSINHNHDTGWKEMIKLLKTHENSSNTNACEKYFFPLTVYAIFIIEWGRLIVGSALAMVIWGRNGGVSSPVTKLLNFDTQLIFAVGG